MVRLGHRTVRAHRFASEVLGRQACPPGYHRDHLCHFSMCVNPDHLEVVPKEVNQERKRARRSNGNQQILPPWGGTPGADGTEAVRPEPVHLDPENTTEARPEAVESSGYAPVD